MDGGAYETAVLNLAVQVLNLVRASLFCSYLSVGPSARDRHSDIHIWILHVVALEYPAVVAKYLDTLK